MQNAKKMQDAMEAKPLTQEAMKGKVDIKWYGHCGFKIQFMDKQNVQRVIYIDLWMDNLDCPDEAKKDGPFNDADLVLITHG